MNFRYFDPAGRQLTLEQLRSMQVLTPAMDHVFATVAARMEKNGDQEPPIVNRPAE